MAYTEWTHSDYTCRQRHGSRNGGRFFDEDDYDWNAGAQYYRDSWTFISCPHETDFDHDYGEDKVVAHRDSIIISVDGACRGNGGPYARSGIGIFVHKNSWLNCASVIDTPNIHTSQRAELYAGLQGLAIAKSIRNRNPRKGDRRINAPGPYRKLRRVVIKADSKYFVNAMTDWIYKWEANGYINSMGTSVMNRELFQFLEHAVDELEGLGVEVQFWHARRDRKGVADYLANAALNGQEVDDAVEEYFEDD